MGVPDVVHFIHALNDRAIADVATRLAEQMRHQGLGVAIVASAVMPEAPRASDIEVIDLGGSGRRTVFRMPALASALRKLRPATIFAHAEGPARAALVATRGMRARPRLVGIVHNHYSSYPWKAPRVRRFLDSVAFRSLDCVVGVSPGVASDLRRTFPAAADRVRMVPEPLTRWDALAELAAEPIDQPWLDQRRPTLVTVGHVHPRKDHETLVRAIAELRTRGEVVPRVAIIGSDGDAYAGHVRRLIDELGLQDDIALLGAIPNPLPYVAAADAFVLSSRNEGLGIVLLEAMGLGTPIISTDAPSGPRWVLEDGRCGVMTPVGDPPALADAITRLLADEPMRRQLVQAGRERAREFTPASVAGQYLELAESLR